MMAHLYRRHRDNPIIFARVPRDHWLALHRLAAAQHASAGDVIRTAIAGVITSVETAPLSSPGSPKTPRPLRTWIGSWVRRQRISRWARWLWWTTRMRVNDHVCSIEIAAPHTGFFAQIDWCLWI